MAVNADSIVYFGYGSLVNRDTRPPEESAACARLRGWHRVWEHRVAPTATREPSCSLSIAPDSTRVPEARASDGSGGRRMPFPDADVDAAMDVAMDAARDAARDVARDAARDAAKDARFGLGTDAGIDGVVVLLPLEALAVLDAREEGYERLTLPASHFDLPAGLVVDEIHVYRSLAENRVSATGEHPILQSYVDCCMAGFLKVYGEGGLDNFLHATRGWDGEIENDRQQPRYPRAVEVPGALLARFDRLVTARRESCLSVQ